MRNRLLAGGALFITLIFILNACGSLELPRDVQEHYASLPDDIDFNRDVKRILSDKCFSCHGPDAKKQKADLRLDIASFAYEKRTESGRKAIKPGSLSGSDVVHRILSADPDQQEGEEQDRDQQRHDQQDAPRDQQADGHAAVSRREGRTSARDRRGAGTSRRCSAPSLPTPSGRR